MEDRIKCPVIAIHGEYDIHIQSEAVHKEWLSSFIRFLNYCNECDLEKSVLDCGAGGDCPPLALFAEYGYKTQGIEISNSQVERANIFSQKWT